MKVAIIGAGRIGGALAALSAEHSLACDLITREHGHQALSSDAGDPILVAVRNDDLDPVLERVPAARRGDLVLIQNGMLRPWLRERGLREVTRGLLFFAVGCRGDRPLPGAPSPFTGPHAPAMVTWLTTLGLPAEVVDAPTFAAIELEKLIWNCAFGLLCQVREADVGVVVDEHAEELQALVAEMAEIGARALGVELDLLPLVERLSAYSRSIAGYRGAVKEWPWRNGWFVSRAAEYGLAMPVHSALLDLVGLP